MSTYKQVISIEDILSSGDVAVTIASPIEVINDAGTQMAVDVTHMGGLGIVVEAGNVTATTQRVTIATDDANLAAITTNTAIRSDGLGVHIRKDQTGHDTIPVFMNGMKTGIGTSYEGVAFGHPDPEIELTDSNVPIVLASTSNNDDLVGTGARVVRVVYCNATGTVFTEDVDTDGQTEVTLANQGVAVFSARVVDAGVSAANGNAGVISVFRSASTAGVPNFSSRVFAHMAIGRSQADQNNWHSSATEAFYPTSLSVSSTGPCTLQFRQQNYEGRNLNQRAITVLLEVLVDGHITIPLTGMGPYNDGIFETLAKASSGTVDVSFAMSGYSDRP